VHATADGHVVVLHDPALDRTTDGHGPVTATPLAELERLDAGHGFTAPDGTHPFRGQGIRVPTLRALLAAHPDVPLNIEIKQDDPPIVDRVLADLDAFGARERTLLAAEHHHIMERIRAVVEGVTAASGSTVTASVGLAHSADGGAALDELIRTADHALLAVKRSGKNQLLAAETV